MSRPQKIENHNDHPLESFWLITPKGLFELVGFNTVCRSHSTAREPFQSLSCPLPSIKPNLISMNTFPSFNRSDVSSVQQTVSMPKKSGPALWLRSPETEELQVSPMWAQILTEGTLKGTHEEDPPLCVRRFWGCRLPRNAAQSQKVVLKFNLTDVAPDRSRLCWPVTSSNTDVTRAWELKLNQ